VIPVAGAAGRGTGNHLQLRERAAVNVHRPSAAFLRRTVGRWAARLLALVFLAAVLAAVTVVVVIPRATQGSAMTVLTGSMTPEIPVGSIVVVRPVDPETLKVGDIATYQKEEGEDTFITHRIVKIDTTTTPTTYIFKGDANRGRDLEPIVPKRIHGQVWFHVPYLGTIRDGLAGKGGFTLVAMLLLGGYAVSQVRAGLRERREDAGLARRLPVDRRMVAAQFARSHGLGPDAVPSGWQALLVHEDSDTFTVLLVPEREVFDDVLDEVRSAAPLTLTVTATSGELVLPEADTSLAAPPADEQTTEPSDVQT
jgi:signal peptidase I